MKNIKKHDNKTQVIEDRLEVDDVPAPMPDPEPKKTKIETDTYKLLREDAKRVFSEGGMVAMPDRVSINRAEPHELVLGVDESAKPKRSFSEVVASLKLDGSRKGRFISAKHLGSEKYTDHYGDYGEDTPIHAKVNITSSTYKPVEGFPPLQPQSLPHGEKPRMDDTIGEKFRAARDILHPDDAHMASLSEREHSILSKDAEYINFMKLMPDPSKPKDDDVEITEPTDDTQRSAGPFLRNVVNSYIANMEYGKKVLFLEVVFGVKDLETSKEAKAKVLKELRTVAGSKKVVAYCERNVFSKMSSSSLPSVYENDPLLTVKEDKKKVKEEVSIPTEEDKKLLIETLDIESLDSPEAFSDFITKISIQNASLKKWLEDSNIEEFKKFRKEFESISPFGETPDREESEDNPDGLVDNEE